jgi:hypothetical protein
VVPAIENTTPRSKKDGTVFSSDPPEGQAWFQNRMASSAMIRLFNQT